MIGFFDLGRVIVDSARTRCSPVKRLVASWYSDGGDVVG